MRTAARWMVALASSSSNEPEGLKVTAARPPSSSPWAPLRITVFRWLWLASLVSNVGTWMQTVGAQWFLVHAAHAAILVSLVQTADMLPTSCSASSVVSWQIPLTDGDC